MSKESLRNTISKNLISQRKIGDKVEFIYGRPEKPFVKRYKYMGEIHRKFIREKAITPIDDNIVVNNGRIERLSKFEKQVDFDKFGGVINFKKFETPKGNQLGKNKFVESIRNEIVKLRRSGDMRNRQVSIRIIGPDGSKFFRTISGKGARNDRELVRKIEEWEKEDIRGRINMPSDIVGSDNAIGGGMVDTSFIGITSFDNPGGGGTKTKKYKNVANEFYISRNYSSHKSNKNNCLMDCLRSQTDRKFKTCASIRKDLKLDSKSMIDINKINIFEDYFGMNINVICDEQPDFKVYFDDEKLNKLVSSNRRIKLDLLIKQFRTRVEETPQFIYRTKKKYDKTVNLLLKDQHYTVILNSKNNYCEISGLSYNKKKPKASEIKRHLIKCGRLDHYFNVLKMKGYEMKKNKIEKKKVSFTVCFFDFETIYNDEFCLVPYSVVYKIKGGEPVFYKGFDCLKKFMKDIMTCKKRLVLIGYNSSRFDNFFIAQYCFEMDILKKNSVFYVQNSILQLNFGGHKVFDLCRILMCSLKNGCDSFKTKHKKIDGFSHEKMQKLYKAGKLEEFLKKNSKELEEYNKMDVLALEDLYNLAEESCKKLIDNFKLKDKNGEDEIFKLYNYFTISSLTFETWTKICKKKNEGNFIKAPQTEEQYNNIRSSMTAGRTEVFFKDEFTKCLIFYLQMRGVDVTSLYPFVMEKFQYPKGDLIETKEYVKGKLGVYRCNILKQPKKNIFPKREKDKPLDWKSTEPIINQWLTSVDIESLKKHNGKVEIFEGYYWLETFNPFTEYISVFKKDKMLQDSLKGTKNYNGAKREMDKLFMNSLSGKVLQRIFKDEFTIVSTLKEYRNFIEKNKVKELNLLSNGDVAIKGEKRVYNYNRDFVKPCQFGVFIYAYARRHMYDNIISKYDVQYMDTDSAFLKIDDYYNFLEDHAVENIKDKMPKLKKEMRKEEYYKMLEKNSTFMGNEFGKLKEEIGENTGKESIYLAPKCYFVEAKIEKNSKRKFKGVGKGDKWFKKKDLIRIEKGKLKFKDIRDIFSIGYSLKEKLINMGKIIRMKKIKNKLMKGKITDEEIYKIGHNTLSYSMFKELYNINTQKKKYRDKITIFCAQLTKHKFLVDKKTGRTKVFQVCYRLLKKEIGKIK